MSLTIIGSKVRANKTVFDFANIRKIEVYSDTYLYFKNIEKSTTIKLGTADNDRLIEAYMNYDNGLTKSDKVTVKD